MLTRMKKILTTILTALSLSILAGCGAAEASPAGTYELQKEGLAEQMLQAVPEAARANAKGMIEEAVKGMKASFTLKDDGTAEMSRSAPNPMGGAAMEEKMSGTWKLEGEKMTIALKDADGNDFGGEITYKAGALTLSEKKGDQTMTMNFKMAAAK